jgi:peptide/nickel transport system permease protein
MPTLVVVSFLTFLISTNAPGDPVDVMLNKNQGGEGQGAQKLATEMAYNNLRHKLGLDLPIFYFSFTNSTVSDTLYRIAKKGHRATLQRLAHTYGNWDDVAKYYTAIRNFENELYVFKKDSSIADELAKMKEYTQQLYEYTSEQKIVHVFSALSFFFNSNPTLQPLNGSFQGIRNGFEGCVHNQSPINKYIPAIHFYGTHNQYHRWLFGSAPWFFGEANDDDTHGFLRGDFGISYQDKRAVSSVIWDALPNTMYLSLISIIIAYLIALPIGVKSAVNKGRFSERATTTGLFILYSLPNFWIATMMVFFLCGGDFLSWFPAAGSPPIPDDAPVWYKITEGIYRSILPLFCWTYASLAFISRQMRGGMLNVIGQDYIRTARAKGLDEKTVIWKHAFKNSLLPVITLFASIFPLSIAGSFVIESVFAIPGMGSLTIKALTARDYPIIFTTMMFTAILTMVGNLAADILYAFVDPRISFSSKK